MEGLAHRVPFWSIQRTSKNESKSEKDTKNAIHFLPSSGLFWVNAHCRRLSARAPPGTAAVRGCIAAGDGGTRWMVTRPFEVIKVTRRSPSFGASTHFPRA